MPRCGLDQLTMKRNISSRLKGTCRSEDGSNLLQTYSQPAYDAASSECKPMIEARMAIEVDERFGDIT